MLGKFLHRSTLLFLERPDGEKETNSALISKQPFHNIIKSIYIKLFHYLSCFFITMENKSPEQVSNEFCVPFRNIGIRLLVEKIENSVLL